MAYRRAPRGIVGTVGTEGTGKGGGRGRGPGSGPGRRGGQAAADQQWMMRALALARRGHPHPNPYVGAVVVRSGKLVGEGFHARQGKPHAEALALARAGARARGATLYITLEPCDHEGLTPPCSHAIIAAGIRRVVVAARDHDPRVRGRGLSRLRRAGVRVEVGLLRDEAAAMNEAYNHYQATGRPFVELKLAASLDGKLALETGPARWITGPAARKEGHRLRARADAVLIGAGTLRADDPQLTVRGVRGKSPVRVILTRTTELPVGSRLFHDGAAPTWVVTGTLAERSATARRLARLGVEILAIGPGNRGGAKPRGRHGATPRPRRQVHLRLDEVLESLGRRGIRRLLVEGGAEVATGFLAAGLVDRLHVHLAPLILGGEHPGWPGALGIQRVADGLALEAVEVRRLGADLAIVGRPRRRSRRPRARRATSRSK